MKYIKPTIKVREIVENEVVLAASALQEQAGGTETQNTQGSEGQTVDQGDDVLGKYNTFNVWGSEEEE